MPAWALTGAPAVCDPLPPLHAQPICFAVHPERKPARSREVRVAVAYGMRGVGEGGLCGNEVVDCISTSAEMPVSRPIASSRADKIAPSSE